MKTILNNAKKVFFGILLTATFLSLNSCAKTISFLPSAVVPAAEGQVKVKKDGNKNQHIEIEIYNLAEPKNLQPPKQMYIVWMETDNNSIKNIGQIITSSGSFSRNLKAKFETVTSYTPVKIFITAENDANVEYPGRVVVLSTNQFKR
jgi:hypothetical protein